jgi:photosystem II stability/assembly factor-like uncharacterized protein
MNANALAVMPAVGGTGGTNLFAGTREGLFLSTNSGTRWTAVNSGLANTEITALAVSGTNLFAGTFGGGVFRTTNNGTSWTEANAGLTEDDVYCLAVSGANLFAGTGFWGRGGVFLSTNDGTSWTDVSSGLPSTADVNSLAVSGTNLYAATRGGGVFLSTNNGTTWTAVSEGLPRTSYDTTHYASVQCFASSGQALFAGIDGSGVFLSTNSGTSWTAVNAGLANMNVLALTVSGTNLFAGTYGGGGWSRPLSEMITSVKSIASGLPHEFVLHQNYPNPFNPSTAIKYELPKSTVVRLTVYDMLGREVSVLVNERRDAGVHEVKFDASGLSSGAYFYRIQAGDFVQTRRLLLVR